MKISATICCIILCLVIFLPRMGLSAGLDAYICELREAPKSGWPASAVPVPAPANALWRSYITPGFYERSVLGDGEACGNQDIYTLRIYEDGLICANIRSRDHGRQVLEHIDDLRTFRLNDDEEFLTAIKMIITQGLPPPQTNFTQLTCSQDLQRGEVVITESVKNCTVGVFKDKCDTKPNTILVSKCPGQRYFINDEEYLQEAICQRCSNNKCQSSFCYESSHKVCTENISPTSTGLNCHGKWTWNGGANRAGHEVRWSCNTSGQEPLEISETFQCADANGNRINGMQPDIFQENHGCPIHLPISNAP